MTAEVTRDVTQSLRQFGFLGLITISHSGQLQLLGDSREAKDGIG